MTPEEFKAQLQPLGFHEFVLVEWPANGGLDEHTHPFEARALILSGEITLESMAARRCTGRVRSST
jgi:hypothetical protein